MSDEIKKLRTELHSIQQQFDSIKQAYNSLQLSFAQIEMIYEFAAALNTSIELTDLLDIIKNRFEQNQSIGAFALLLRDKASDTFSINTQYNVSAKFKKKDSEYIHKFFRSVLETKQHLSISKSNNDIGLSAVTDGALICIPLENIQGEIFGLLLLQLKNKEQFTEREIELYRRLSKHIAGALDNILRYEHFKELSFKDELTGLYNRRYFFQRFEIEKERSDRYKRPMAVLMLDIDHFKKYNDTNGHLMGDELLCKIAKILKKILRKPDILARYGGEEFIILLPETSKAQAKKAAEKLRQKVELEKFAFEENQPLEKVTISIGVSSFPDDTKLPEKLIELADEALYEAKHKGRNRVVWLN